MTVPAFNTVAWFQVGTTAPDEARSFYGDLFGWKFAHDPEDEGYDLISYPGAEQPSGGMAHTASPEENHALFYVLVENVDATCAQTEKSGGKVVVPPKDASGGLRFAHLEDPAGNRFAVFNGA